MRSFIRFAPIALLAGGVVALGCGGDDDTSGSGGTGNAGPGSGAGSTSSTTMSVGPGGGGMGGGNTGGAGGAGTGGAPPGCDMLPAAPLTPELVFAVLNGSEDIAFDGKGHIAGKDGGDIVLVDSMGMTTPLATGIPDAYGLRYRADGHLVVALPQGGKLLDVSPAGDVTDYVTGVAGPNGVYPDFDGNVWVTEFAAQSKVTRVNPDKSKDVIVSGADAAAANGVVYDAKRKVLFYTNYQAGKIRRVDPAAAPPAPIEVVTIPNAALDGMVLDACGNIYVMDQGNSDMYRVKLDAAGDAVGEAELLASFPKNVANAQFGSGSGFDPQKLYAAGTPGSVYSVAVGVAGAPVPVAP